jgi:dTDP-4-dehydrorhamnose 3,5-epimerase
MLTGSKDRQTVTSEWQSLRQSIHGVMVREVKNIVTGNGITTELFRDDWGMADAGIKHIIQNTFRPWRVSAWHLHRERTDYFFVVRGAFKAVFYDDREQSPTRGMVNVFNLSLLRPQMLVLPPRVWHGFQNITGEESIQLVYSDREYCYADPDEWRLPPDSPEVPYSFGSSSPG